MTEWVKQDIGGCISRLVGRKRISAEWDAYDTNDVLSDEEKLCGLSDPSSDKLSEQYPKDIDKLAARLVNNRVTEPIRAIAYGHQDGIIYGPEIARLPSEPDYDRSLMISMINGESLPRFLDARLTWMTLMTLGGIGVFYLFSVLGAENGWGGGFVAFLASVLFILIWLVSRVIRVQMRAGLGGFFRQKLNVETIEATAIAQTFLDRTLDEFIGDIESFLNDCLADSDTLIKKKTGRKKPKMTDSYEHNADAVARAMVTWAMSRRAAQYLSFQPTNTREKYERNGVSLAKIAIATSSYYALLALLIGLIIVLSVVGPSLLDSFFPGTSNAMMTVEFRGEDFQIWPMLNAIFVSVIAVILSHGDISTYRQDRDRVTLAMDDFWRRGEVRTAKKIADLPIPYRTLYDRQAEDADKPAIYPTASVMIQQENERTNKPRKLGDNSAIREWEKSLIWKDRLVKLDPTPKLMQRYIKFLETVGSRNIVHNRDYSGSKNYGGLQRDFSGADARPRTRALAMLSRREIWHP